MTSTDLCYLTATEALTRFRNRTLSPVTLMDALIARAEAVNLDINAFTDCYFDEARAKAREAEARYANGTARPLEGLAVAVKDAQRVGGKRTTYGSLALMENVDTRSDPMIERLEAAGAIIHARTATPEFCLSGMCWSRAWGITRNPFNPDYTPGGSSGGSSAALAAGMTTLATGTDIGGSIRIPAGTCAIVGFKPPHGRNPDGPPSNFDLYNHCGPMTRSVADAALVQNIVSGPHSRDHWSLRDRLVIPDSQPPAKGMKIAWSMDLGFMQVDPEVRSNTRAALDVLRGLGCTVEEVTVPWTLDIEKAAVHWYNSMHYGRQTIWHAANHAELLTSYALNYARFAASHTGLDDMAHSWDTVQAMYEFFGPLMERYDAFICPTNGIPAVKADHDPANPDFYVNGVKVDPENGWIMTYPFNMLHNCPVMSVPSGRSPTTGVPTGIQIVGRSFDDATVFRLASAYEAAASGLFVTAGNHPL